MDWLRNVPGKNKPLLRVTNCEKGRWCWIQWRVCSGHGEFWLAEDFLRSGQLLSSTVLTMPNTRKCQRGVSEDMGDVKREERRVVLGMRMSRKGWGQDDWERPDVVCRPELTVDGNPCVPSGWMSEWINTATSVLMSLTFCARFPGEAVGNVPAACSVPSLGLWQSSSTNLNQAADASFSSEIRYLPDSPFTCLFSHFVAPRFMREEPHCACSFMFIFNHMTLGEIGALTPWRLFIYAQMMLGEHK